MSVGKDTAYNLVAAAAPILFMVPVTPFYLAAIGTERFGMLAICWTLLAAIRFASLGMGPALTYQLALMADAPAAARSRMTWTAIFASLAASLVGALLVYAAGLFYFEYVLSAPEVAQGEIRAALPILAALCPIGILSGVLNGALQGRREFRGLTATAVLNSALVALLPFAAAYLVGPGLQDLVLAVLLANLVTLALQFALCRTVVPINVRPHAAAEDLKRLSGYGAWMSVTSLVAPIVLVFDRLIIGALRGPAAAAIYVLPYNIVQGLLYLPASLSNAALPRVAPMLEDGEVRRLQSQAIGWLSATLTPMTVAAIALAAPFFRLWIGPVLGPQAVPVAVILLVGTWIHGIGHVPSMIVLGKSRPDLLAKLLVAGLIPYVCLLVFATSRFGIVGAAAAWTARAALDPLLFMYSKPLRADVSRMAGSATIVVAAMACALIFEWTSAAYWLALCTALVAACFINRDILIACASVVGRKAQSVTGGLQGELHS